MGKLFYSPKMLSDDILSSWIGRTQCSPRLAASKSFYLLSQDVRVQILNRAMHGRKLDLAQDKIISLWTYKTPFFYSLHSNEVPSTPLVSADTDAFQFSVHSQM